MRLLGVEVFRRSCHITLGHLDVLVEFRSADWPRQFGYVRDTSDSEIWIGRLYICVSHREVAPPEACLNAEILAFPGPCRTSDDRGDSRPNAFARISPSETAIVSIRSGTPYA